MLIIQSQMKSNIPACHLKTFKYKILPKYLESGENNWIMLALGPL